MSAAAMESTLQCLAAFDGKRKDADDACLAALKQAGVACDPGLLAPDGTAGKKVKGGSADKVAERIVREANAEACMTDQAKAPAEQAPVAVAAAPSVAGLAAGLADADAKAQADSDAKAAAELKAQADADARAAAEEKAADLKAQAAADAKAQAAADARAQADADARAAAEEKAADDKVKAAAKGDADAQTAALAAALTEAGRKADAPADAPADKADARAEAKAAKALERAEAKAAKAEARDQRRAAADAQAQAEADAKAQRQADADTAAKVKAEADAQAKKAEETAASETAAREAARSAKCTVELVDAAGEKICADTMSQAEIAAVTAAATAKSDVQVTTRTVRDDATRSSDQEFSEPKRRGKDGGLSNLEGAGLLALGAAVVGAVLQSGETVTARTEDRIVVQDRYGNYIVKKDDDVLVRQAGNEVRTERFGDGSTRSVVTRKNGVRIATIRDSSGQVIRRTRTEPDGREIRLIDDTRRYEPVEVSKLPRPRESDLAYRDATDAATLRKALRAPERRDIGRSFSLRQVREYREVRDLAPEINLDDITFQTASAAIQATEAAQLRDIGLLMLDFIEDDPRELFLIEGYTDAIGDESQNLLLSDRRAETVALALSEYFGVPPENMVVQGYGERFPLIPTLKAERLNRRVAIRRITGLTEPR